MRSKVLLFSIKFRIILTHFLFWLFPITDDGSLSGTNSSSTFRVSRWCGSFQDCPIFLFLLPNGLCVSSTSKSDKKECGYLHLQGKRFRYKEVCESHREPTFELDSDSAIQEWCCRVVYNSHIPLWQISICKCNATKCFSFHSFLCNLMNVQMEVTQQRFFLLKRSFWVASFIRSSFV